MAADDIIRPPLNVEAIPRDWESFSKQFLVWTHLRSQYDIEIHRK